jgi:hypothetical protein
MRYYRLRGYKLQDGKFFATTHELDFKRKSNAHKFLKENGFKLEKTFDHGNFEKHVKGNGVISEVVNLERDDHYFEDES